MLYLFHGATSVCAIKVRLTLAEKSLPWQGEILALQKGDQFRPEYLKLNPNAVVPTLVDDGKVVIESTVIMEYLDESFSEVPLMPREPHARAQVRLWLRRVDDLHVHTGALTTATAFRRYFMRQRPDGRDAYVGRVRDKAKRERLAHIMRDGLAAPEAGEAARRHDAFLGHMETALAPARYLGGADVSLADIAAIPYVNRCDVLGLSPLWENSRPLVADWLARMRQRPSFATAVTAWWDDDAKERFDVPREAVWAECKQVLACAR